VELSPTLRHLEIYTMRGLLTVLWHGPLDAERVVLMSGGAMGGMLGPAGGLYPDLGERFAADGIGTMRVGYRKPNDLVRCVHDVAAAGDLATRAGARRFVTVGHSFGGAVALQAGMVLGEHCRGIVTLATQSAGCEDAGNLRATAPDLAQFQRGEAPVGILWDYLALEYKDQLEGQVNLEITVPQDASIAGPYASIINKWAPHPYAARLMRNFILSPEGQTIYARGYATPILPSVEIPPEIQERRPPPETYAAVRPIENWPAAVVSSQAIAERWSTDVLG